MEKLKKWFLLVFILTVGKSLCAQDHALGINEPDFFPIAVWAQNPENAAAYKKNGINLFINIYGGLDARKLRRMQAAGMKMIAHQNQFGLTQLDEPLIYAWMHDDSPDNAQQSETEKNKWDPCRDPADIIRSYKKIKKNDPSRPVYLNLGPGAAYANWIGRGVCRGRTDMYKISNNGYLKGCDIASFDIYPINAREDELKEKLWYVAKGIDNLKDWSENQKPAWCWIEATRISERTKRRPTPSEVKAEVWMALIHGAKGFGYFCHSFVDSTKDDALLQDAEMIQAIREINTEVTSLAPILNSADTKGYATVTTSNKSVPIDIMTKKDGKMNYLFAVAMRDGPTTATFRVKSGKTVEVIGEGRTIDIRRKHFTDLFSSYGVHLYRITK